MNWPAFQAVGSIIGLLATIVIFAIGQAKTHGSLTEKVGEHGRRLDDYDDKFGQHEQRIGKVEIEAAKSEGFRQGVMSSTK